MRILGTRRRYPLVATVIAKLMNVVDGDLRYQALWMWCPGCEDLHRVAVAGQDAPAICWEWNGDLAAPTIHPSILTWRGPDDAPTHRCHSFVQDGNWKFLSDCTHELAGQTVPLPPLPDWLAAPDKKEQ